MRPRNAPPLADVELSPEIQEFDMEPLMRQIVREEISSLCGLMLNRLSNSGQPGAALMRSAWGEALADFSGHTGEGEEPGAPESDAA